MSKIKELRERQARILENARAKRDEVTDETPEERAAEIDREFDRMMADYDKLGSEIERELKLQRAQAELEEVDERRRPSYEGEQRGGEQPEGIDYREAFQEYLRAQGNVGAMSAEARSVLERGYQKVDVDKEKRAQTTTAAAGGYSIPETMLQRVVETMAAFGPMYDDNGPFTVIPTDGGNPMPFPTVDDTAGTAVAHTEGATLTDDGGSDVTFGEKVLNAYAFDTEWLRVSKELADDSFLALERFIGKLLGKRLARLANAKLTTGSGSSDVEGIAAAAVAGKVAAANNAITYDEILDLEHSVNRAYRTNNPSVGYMLSDQTALAVRKLKDGDGNYLWQAGNVQAGIPATINGRPYWINDDMADLTSGVSSKVMLFGDMSNFYVRKVGQPLIGAIQDKDFWPGFGIAGYIRFDGALADTAAVKALALAAA
ncbi:phage major capsid protein [Maritimibacter sp. DP07]|uniref:Phage major capsid protein n=1 Tax=Maritimibacter harenae TaxID=2606218 RepID=A0A845M4T7_9RHOB|nr:phage major capsid protein [Maritimibacter harenae]MZR14232.1 phage major capsid protein [Maritimibacter harenae]